MRLLPPMVQLLLRHSPRGVVTLPQWSYMTSRKSPEPPRSRFVCWYQAFQSPGVPAVVFASPPQIIRSPPQPETFSEASRAFSAMHGWPPLLLVGQCVDATVRSLSARV